MTDNETFEKLSAVIAETLGLDDITMTRSTSAEEVDGWDSVAHVQIMVAVESAFGIRFRTSDMTGLRNVGELADRIVQRSEAGK